MGLLFGPPCILLQTEPTSHHVITETEAPSVQWTTRPWRDWFIVLLCARSSVTNQKTSELGLLCFCGLCTLDNADMSAVVLKTQVLVSRLSFNVSVLVLGHKVLVFVSSWTLQALVLGLGSSEPCMKLKFFQKGSFLPPTKKIIFRVFGYTCGATPFFYYL